MEFTYIIPSRLILLSKEEAGALFNDSFYDMEGEEIEWWCSAYVNFSSYKEQLIKQYSFDQLDSHDFIIYNKELEHLTTFRNTELILEVIIDRISERYHALRLTNTIVCTIDQNVKVTIEPDADSVFLRITGR